MKIIEANKFHIPIIIEMLKHYRECTPIDMFKNINDEEYIIKLLSYIFAGKGTILLSYKDDVPTGMLIAFIDSNIWDSNFNVLKELAYWVEPEYRGSSAGYRLLKRYNEIGEELLSQGRIKTWTISKMINSPNLDYSKLGFNKIEETWSMGT